MRKFNKIIWGFILIILGVIFGLNALEITNIDVFFEGWWTLFIIVPCFINLFTERNKTGNVVGLIIGFLLLLACNDFISFGLIFKLIVPVFLVLMGLSLIFKNDAEKDLKNEIKRVKESCNNNEHYAIFGSLDLSFANEKFKGCYLNAIFGGVDLIMPDDFNVKVVSTPIFGGVSDERKNKNIDSKNTIFVNATCMFGGVNIK